MSVYHLTFLQGAGQETGCGKTLLTKSCTGSNPYKVLLMTSIRFDSGSLAVPVTDSNIRIVYDIMYDVTLNTSHSYTSNKSESGQVDGGMWGSG